MASSAHVWQKVHFSSQSGLLRCVQTFRGNSATRFPFIRYFKGGIGRPFAATMQYCKASRPLLEYVQKVEKSFQESNAGEQKPNIKAERGKGLNSFMQNTRSHILGFDVAQVQKRVEILESFGMSSKDALSVAFEVPSHLDFKRDTLKPLCELLNNLGCNLLRLFMKAPYIFGVNFSTVESNVKRLENVGIRSEVIGKAIESNPLLVVYPVSDKAVEIIRVVLSSCEFDNELINDSNSDIKQISQSDFALQLLQQPFDGAREQVLLGDNVKEVANFLREIQVSPCLMVLNNPEFFSADVNKLYEAVEFFTGRPLLFEIELIQKMMITKPEVFLNLERKAFEKRVRLLQGIVNTPTQLYLLLQKYFVFQGNEVELEGNIKVLQKYEFQNEQIANIITAKGSFVSRVRELEKKLQFLLSVEGINVDLISKNFHCLLKPLKFLENRVNFARKLKKELLENINMQSLFLSDDEAFVTVICESSLEKYEESTARQKKTKGAV